MSLLKSLPFYNWRAILSLRTRNGDNITPNLNRATHILATANRMKAVDARIALNQSIKFYARFRTIVQIHQDLQDCGYYCIVQLKSMELPKTDRDHVYMKGKPTLSRNKIESYTIPLGKVTHYGRNGSQTVRNPQ